MHISIIANNFTEEYIYNVVNNLSKNVDKVDLIGSSLYQEDRVDPKINFYKLRDNHEGKVSVLVKSFRILNYYQKLIRYLFTTPATIIHIQWLRFHFVEGVLMTLLMRALGKKVVYTAHNMLPHDEEGLYYRTLFNIIYKLQNELIVHTSFIKSQLLQTFKLNADRIHVVHHGVFEREKNPLITKSFARAKLGLSEATTVILFFGKIVAYKGFDTLVRCMDILEDDTTYEILVAGKVLPHYQKELESLVANKKHGKYIFLLKFLSEEEVEYCFKAADVTVLPYKEASQSGVLFMSYAFGVPVIVPNMGGFPDDIVPQKTGYLFEANNPESLASTLNQFTKEWQYAGLKEETFITDFAEQNYSWDAACKKLVQIYH